MKRLVLAYSSALEPVSASAVASDSPARGAIAWLADKYSAEIVTLTLDFGQGRELEALRDRALAHGAVRAHVLDVASLFAASYVLPTLRAGALYAGGQCTTTGLGRALIAQKLVEVAAIEQTTLVAHGGSNDPRIAAAVQSLDARLKVVTVPTSSTAAADAWSGPRVLINGEPPAEPASVEIAFVRGAPTAVNGIAMPLVDLLGSLDMLAGLHRVGRFDHLETPAMFVLHTAHAGIQTEIGVDLEDRGAIATRYAALIERGEWFSSERKALDYAVTRLEQTVTGSVRAELTRGHCRLAQMPGLAPRTSGLGPSPEPRAPSEG